MINPFEKTSSRYEMLDFLKAIAVSMMIFFHLCYDLNTFHFIDINISKDTFWRAQPWIIISLFLICVGMGLTLVHKEKIRWNAFIKRSFKLLVLSSCISLVTFLVFKERWVYFGILHHILVASFLALPFLRWPKTSFVLGICLIIPSAFFQYVYPFIKLSTRPVDHVALFPWFGFVLIGIFLFSMDFHKVQIKNFKGKKFFLLLGKYSLEIYILHQAILFPSVYLLYKIFL